MIRISNLKTDKPILPQDGGPLEATFDARTASGDSRLEATYSLAQTEPWVFASGAKTAALAATAVSSTARSYPRQLEVRRQGGGIKARLDIPLEVQEIDAGGAPIGASRKGTFSVTISLQETLKQVRAERELTQEDVATATGLSTSTISRVERGFSYSVATHERILEIL